MGEFLTVEVEQQRLDRSMRSFLSRQLPHVRDIVVRKTALDIVALTTRSLNGVAGLPKRIDTGRLRAGWRLALASMGFQTTGLAAPVSSDPDNPTRSDDGSGEYEHNATASVATVSNNVEYARYVEDGTVKMAPGHHLKRALRLAAAPFRKALAQGVHGEFTGRGA